MRCPFCSNEDSQVKDSRPTEDNTAIRRRRICDQCGSRFTTFERIQLRDLVVVKNQGQKENFDRDKMFRSLSLALRKRTVDNEKIEKIVISKIFKVFSILICSGLAESKILVTYSSQNESRKNVLGRLITQNLKIPKELIDYKKNKSCKENSRYDMVICLTTKNGELMFPTLKKNLIKKKYEIFIKN